MMMWKAFLSNPVGVLLLSAGLMALPAQAAWIGAGTAGGDPAATNFNDTANWQGGAINGDFRTVISNVTIRLTADYNATNGLDFAEQDKSFTRHMTLTGTNMLTLSANIAGYSNAFPRSIMLPSNGNNTVTLDRGLTVNLPSGFNQSIRAGSQSMLFVDARVTGVGRMTAHYWGGGNPYVVLRNDANTFEGGLDQDAGQIYVSSINTNRTAPSASGTNFTTISVANSPMHYIGSRTVDTARPFNFGNEGMGLNNWSGCGGLNLTGTVSIGTNPRTCVALGGISAAESLITAPLYNNDTISKFTRLEKKHSGTWRLTGANTFTGWTNSTTHNITLSGGTLIADYTNDVAGAGSNRLFLAGRTVSFSDGRLLIRGKTGAGNTTWQSFGTNTVADTQSSVLSIDANGGDGTAMVWDTLVMSGGTGLLTIEKAGNASLTVTNAFSTSSGSVRAVNGVLMALNGTRSDILVKDPDGRVGFAVQSGTLEIVRNPDTVELATGNGTVSTHASLAASLTRTANLALSTLTIDATANDVTLDMAGYAFQADNSAVGRGVAIYGGHNVAVQGGAHGAQSSTFIFNYGTGKLTWALTNGTCAYVSAGPGLTEFTQGLAQNLYIAGGIARLTAAKNYTEGAIILYGNGVLEIGADLNGATAGDFTRTVTFNAGGGFSACGADRTVNLGGTVGVYIWASGFVPDGKPFILSSPYADATLIFANPVDLNQYPREIRVQNGSAAIDACLTNRIYGSKCSAVVKSGSGTLELRGAQSYRGNFSVIAGGLRLGANDVFAGGTNALVLSGATLDAGTFRNAFDTLELLSDSVIAAGNGSASLSFSDSSAKTWTGRLSITGKLGPTTLRFGTDGNGLTAAQLATITCRGFSVRLSGQGYLLQNPPGTMISVR
ncbi:MAG TPA: hypothetical protein PKM57_01320 [Kiritimatiellia bacterium]|nr:hypothetical protein [Kiritimatiellia bacterium]HPS08273.1 hypothetical protein [Kiritimatiellia bacterium]